MVEELGSSALYSAPLMEKCFETVHFAEIKVV